MRKLPRRLLAITLCCLLFSNRPTHAESLHTAAVEIIVGIVAVTAVLTVGVVLAVKHHPSLKGCAANAPDGLQLTTGDGQTYLLVGDLDGLKSGDKIRVSGKKQKDSSLVRKFIVEKSKVYGPCPTSASS